MKSNGGKSFHHLIHSPKDLSQILFTFMGLSPSQLRVLVAGIFGVGIGVAGLIMARRDGNLGCYCISPWASKMGDSSESLCFVAGLQNLGNNCFLNVILQALASCCSFLPFLQNIVVTDNSTIEGSIEDLPLAVALVALLKELCILRDERIVLSPRKVMLAIGHYVSSFNLTRQQDAAEALLYLLSSLQEECSGCYVPHNGSLADIFTVNIGRLSNPKGESVNELERWQQYHLVPFDGTLGSILTCRRCSFQVQNMETASPNGGVHRLYVHWRLHHFILSMDGCALEDCLKQFTAVEHIENYRCNRCWHVIAIKFLSLKVEENEEKIKRLKDCVNYDSCDCKNLLPEGLPFDISCASKQLSIGRCPKILCIHLQRVSTGELGEILKLQGHISFPLVLDVFPFTTAALGIGLEISAKDIRKKGKKPLPLVTNHNRFHMPTFPFVYGLAGEYISSEEKLGLSFYRSSGDNFIQTRKGESCGSNAFFESTTQIFDGAGLKSKCGMDQQHDDKLNRSDHSRHSKSYMYHLVSVVEHYGKAGGGHYGIYRRVKGMPVADDFGRLSETADVHWFYVSDAKVLPVSEEAVLAAEASLLFYERIDVSV